MLYVVIEINNQNTNKGTAQVKDNSTIQTAEILLANLTIPIDQKAKENSGSGLSWHRCRGLAPFLRFRGRGVLALWIWDLESPCDSCRGYCGISISLAIGVFFVPSVYLVYRVQYKVPRVQFNGGFLFRGNFCSRFLTGLPCI